MYLETRSRSDCIMYKVKMYDSFKLFISKMCFTQVFARGLHKRKVLSVTQCFARENAYMQVLLGRFLLEGRLPLFTCEN